MVLNNQTTHNTQLSKLATMFCKVCYDSGKSSYDTHNVRDFANNVICPVLLNTKCRNCSSFGHTAKYCKSKNIVSQIRETSVKTIKSVNFGKDVKSYSVGQTFTKPMISFCSLAVEDDSDDEECDIEFSLDNIVWGVGHRDMIDVRWSDYCDV